MLNVDASSSELFSRRKDCIFWGMHKTKAVEASRGEDLARAHWRTNCNSFSKGRGGFIPFGKLCASFGSPKQRISAFGMHSNHNVNVSAAEKVANALASLIESTVRSEDEHPIPRARAVELVQFMDAKGIFLVKGSVAKVAHTLGVSNMTVYSYLD